MQNYNGPPNVGIRLMSKMGYGVAGMRLHCLIAAAAPSPISLHQVIAVSRYMPDWVVLPFNTQPVKQAQDCITVFCTTVTDYYVLFDGTVKAMLTR